jgi:hypothetical protein
LVLFALLFGFHALFLRASTRVRRCVFFSGDGGGVAVSVTASFAGLGAGVGSAAKRWIGDKADGGSYKRDAFYHNLSDLSFQV